MLWIALAIGAYLAIPLHILVMFAFGAACGIRAETVSVGIGPKLRWRTSGATFALGLLPCGGFVKFVSGDFASGPLWARIGTNLAGCAALLALGAALGGWIDPWRVWKAIPALALHPRTQGAEVFLAYAKAFSATPLAALGEFCCVVAAVNLLPLPLLNGGEAILSLVRYDPDSPPVWLTVVRYASLIGAIGLMICLIIALGSAAWPARSVMTTGTSTPTEDVHLRLRPAP